MVAQGELSRLTSFPCNVDVEHGVQYRRVRWYKVEEGADGFTGLVLKNLQTNETLLYKSAQHSYQVGEDYSLILSNSSLSDCGRYRCTLWPPVGHQIKEGDYDFYPRGCPQPVKMQKSDVVQSKQQSSSRKASVPNGAVVAAVGLIVLLAVLSAFIYSWRSK